MRLGTFLTCSTLSFCYANTALRGGGGGRVGDADAGVWLGEEGERGSGTGAAGFFFWFLIIFKIN